ncbi:PRC-barrel domain containing protein [Erythrobacter litoralis]|uniref:PRC-barrel domain-containing protein n=1 Tax=Erythrobacter litoralis TaxID=39960 RepID=UPI0024348E5C|nr:PRC-barrel domain-containing protein [Erythrobacter litoralis]MDG6079220.1 PRC-barrel domain containing protein [Erythrobacter litoralis]
MTHHDNHNSDLDSDRFGKLESLSDWQLVNEDQDIRGYPVRSATGEEYGKVEDMLVDKDGEHVLALRLTDGRTVPVDNIDIHSDHVIYRDAAAASPASYTRVRRRTV